MNHFIFDIWLHVGREGRCFSYQDGNNLDIDLGDVVTVRLKGQLCLLYTSPSPRDGLLSRMPSSA